MFKIERASIHRERKKENDFTSGLAKFDRYIFGDDLYNILREKSLAIYFGDSQFRRNGSFNFIVSKIYVDKRSRVR